MACGYSEQEISHRFAGQGIRAFMQKPHDLATRRSQVRAALAE